MAGLVIVEPTTILRDWARDELDMPEVWAGGWPQGNTADAGIVLEVISSTLNVAVTTWSTQWDCYATKAGGGQPAAAQMAADLAVLLVDTPARTVLGVSGHGQLVYGGAVESSVSMFPVDEEDPDTFRHTLLVDLSIVATDPPPLPPD